MLQFIKNASIYNMHGKWAYWLISICIWFIHLFAWADNKPDAAQLFNNLQQPANKYQPFIRKKDKPQLQEPLVPLKPDIDDPGQEAESELSFEVNGLLFEGNTVFNSAELMMVCGIVPGSTLSLMQLEEKMALITEHYRSAGFPLARVEIPEQVVDSGIVKISVIEPKWGAVVLNNLSAVKDRVILRTASRVRQGELVQEKDLESTAVYLSGLPGANISSELKAGELSGTTDMVIDAQPAPSLTSVVTSDNFGSRYTGRERAGAFISWNNFTQSADTLLLSALSSGSNLNFQQLGYVLPVYRPGMSMGFSMAHMQYVLGNGAESLKAHGHLSQVSYWLLYPLLSTNETKSDVHLQYEETELDDHQDSTGTKNDRQLNKLNVSVNLDRSDAVWNGGVTQINANLTFGRVFFNDAVALANDAATVNTAGEFVKLNVRASRNQSIDQTWSLVLSADAQVANRNLDATQKFSVGGYQSVRAFESGVLSADEALFVSLECRARLPNPPPKFNISGEWYGALFWDGAMTRINKHTWSSSSNHATLRGSGVGVYWQGLDNWRASLAWATAQGVMPDVLAGSISNHRSVWLELSKGWR